MKTYLPSLIYQPDSECFLILQTSLLFVVGS